MFPELIDITSTWSKSNARHSTSIEVETPALSIAISVLKSHSNDVQIGFIIIRSTRQFTSQGSTDL